MVRGRMGLLDDAIREHLELKRRRGADPGEVAREQHEALDPVERGDHGHAPNVLADDGSASDRPQAESVGEHADLLAVAPGEQVDDGAIEPIAPMDAAYGGETAELDMRSVLGDDALPAAGADPALESSPEDQQPQAGAPGTVPAEGDSLEWEMPGDGDDESSVAEEPDEDVLEETPEFLRDTPEQERLWFEQRPPRDFDFDK
jgi:hypothetical protein